MEQEAAARALRQLVTPTGMKVVLGSEDLAAYAGLRGAELESVLRTLSGSSARVLRSTTDPQGAIRYEIFHEVLAPAVLVWLRRLERAGEKQRTNKTFGEAFVIILLFIAAWIYFPGTIFNQEKEPQNPSALPKNLAKEIAQLNKERWELQQNLLGLQAMVATARRAVVLSYLSNHKNDLMRDARAYQRDSDFDFRGYSLAYAKRHLKELGPVPRGSAASYEKEALEFLFGFIEENIPPRSTDLTALDRLLDAYGETNGALSDER